MRSIKTTYIVGHYIQYNVSRDFHVDFTDDDISVAMEHWRHLCTELPIETDVEIRKQTTEVVVSRKNCSDDDLDLNWSYISAPTLEEFLDLSKPVDPLK